MLFTNRHTIILVSFHGQVLLYRSLIRVHCSTEHIWNESCLIFEHEPLPRVCFRRRGDNVDVHVQTDIP